MLPELSVTSSADSAPADGAHTTQLRAWIGCPSDGRPGNVVDRVFRAYRPGVRQPALDDGVAEDVVDEHACVADPGLPLRRAPGEGKSTLLDRKSP
jgi:hypothetical protein